MPGEESGVAAKLHRLLVHVVHELVDERHSDLVDLAPGIGDPANKDVAAVVYAAFGGAVEHWRSSRLGAALSWHMVEF